MVNQRCEHWLISLSIILCVGCSEILRQRLSWVVRVIICFINNRTPSNPDILESKKWNPQKTDGVKWLATSIHTTVIS